MSDLPLARFLLQTSPVPASCIHVVLRVRVLVKATIHLLGTVFSAVKLPSVGLMGFSHKHELSWLHLVWPVWQELHFHYNRATCLKVCLSLMKCLSWVDSWIIYAVTMSQNSKRVFVKRWIKAFHFPRYFVVCIFPSHSRLKVKVVFRFTVLCRSSSNISWWLFLLILYAEFKNIPQ